MCGEEAQQRVSAELWLSSPRLCTYLDPCGDDFDTAMGLYQWSIRLASAVLGDMALFEVALRNAYDRCLSTRLSGETGSSTRDLPCGARSQDEPTRKRSRPEPHQS